MELFNPNARIGFSAKRKIFYAVSAVLMLASLVSLFTRGLNFSVDFTGGVTVEASFPGEAQIDRVRTSLEQAGFAEPQVQNFGIAGLVSL